MDKKNKIEVRDLYCTRWAENSFISSIDKEIERAKKIQAEKKEREQADRSRSKRRLEMLRLSFDTEINV